MLHVVWIHVDGQPRGVAGPFSNRERAIDHARDVIDREVGHEVVTDIMEVALTATLNTGGKRDRQYIPARAMRLGC